jgi:hypothetical protein
VETSQCKHHHYFCWICGNAVDLKTCKGDEQGMAVHENCYLLKVALATESMRLMVRKPVRRVGGIAASGLRSAKVRSSTR